MKDFTSNQGYTIFVHIEKKHGMVGSLFSSPKLLPEDSVSTSSYTSTTWCYGNTTKKKSVIT